MRRKRRGRSDRKREARILADVGADEREVERGRSPDASDAYESRIRWQVPNEVKQRSARVRPYR